MADLAAEVLIARVPALVREFAAVWTADIEDLRAEYLELLERNVLLTNQLRAVQRAASWSETPPPQEISPPLPVVVQQIETAVHLRHLPTPAYTCLHLRHLPTPATPGWCGPAPKAPPPDPPAPAAPDAETPPPAVSMSAEYYKPFATPTAPKVHVLLSPAGEDCNAPPPKLGGGQVIVIGMHKSGTHPLNSYLNKFFNVDVQPNNNEHEGVVNLESCCMWKHTIPISATVLPSRTSKGPVTVMMTVREMDSWMHSLGRCSYGILPSRGGKPKSARELCWMFDQVTIKNVFKNPFPNLHFPNLMDMWAIYTDGYLAGRIAAENDSEAHPQRVLVVRFEDLLERPEEVVNELERLGLPRNAEVFSTIEESVSHAAGTRASILLRECKSHLTDALRDRIALNLAKGSHLINWLGYRTRHHPTPLEHRLESLEPAGAPTEITGAPTEIAGAPSPSPALEPGDPCYGIVCDADGFLYCTMCRNYATECHLLSKRHQNNVNWEKWRLKMMNGMAAGE